MAVGTDFVRLDFKVVNQQAVGRRLISSEPSLEGSGVFVLFFAIVAHIVKDIDFDVEVTVSTKETIRTDGLFLDYFVSHFDFVKKVVKGPVTRGMNLHFDLIGKSSIVG